ncbi:bifunctional DNA primase/polymerase [Cryptosporangium japonicum]|uniref:DNA primase/polymerase bifunctional N-terminal domain-containing protein n=1 Tax=Cryptosporangium japonicum TaxID=80872 RepID=A0ABN0TGU0_9ACTN
MASLATAAHEYLGAGWPVLPGAYWSPQTCTYRCGRPGCDNGSPHPVDRGVPGRCAPRITPPSIPADEVDRWWNDRGFNLIMPTGGAAATVVEGPARFVAALEARLADAGCPPAPVLALPTGERQLFSAPIPVDDELWLATAVGGATLHGDGGWVTLPPSIVSAGKLRWERAPETIGWRLPPATVVRAALRAVLDPGRAAA